MRIKILSLMLAASCAGQVKAQSGDYFTERQKVSIAANARLFQTVLLQLQYTLNSLNAQASTLATQKAHLQTAIARAYNPQVKALLEAKLSHVVIHLNAVQQRLARPWTTFDGRVPIFDASATLPQQIANVQWLLSDTQTAASEADQEANPGMDFVVGKVLRNGTRVSHSYKLPPNSQ